MAWLKKAFFTNIKFMEVFPLGGVFVKTPNYCLRLWVFATLAIFSMLLFAFLFLYLLTPL